MILGVWLGGVVRLLNHDRFLTLELPQETLRISFQEIRYMEVWHNNVTVTEKRITRSENS